MLAVAYSLLIAAAVYLVAGPPLALLHGLGHALPLALAGQPASIRLGRPDMRARPTFSLGKVEFRIRRPLGFGGECRYEEPERGFSAEGELLIALGGPAASALVTLVFGLASYLVSNPLAWALLSAVSIAAFLQVVFSLLPIRYPKWLGAHARGPSDGLRAMWAMGLTRKG